MNLAQTDQIANRDRLFLLILTIPIALLSLGALLIPEPFAHLIGAVGTAPYVYRLVGAAALGYAGAIAWALRSNRWSRVRLLVASLLGFSVAGVLGAILQLLIGDTKGIVYLILVLGLIVAAFTAYLLTKHRGWVQPVPNIHNWLVIFFIVATLVAVPLAIMPLFFPAAFAQLFSFQANDLLLYRLGGAELTGYVALGILEVQSRDMAEIHPAAIMVFFFNAMAVVASLLALFTGERSSLIYVVIVVSGAIAVLTVLELSRRTGGDLFGDREFAPQPSQ